jgi:hypothetical protein
MKNHFSFILLFLFALGCNGPSHLQGGLSNSLTNASSAAPPSSSSSSPSPTPVAGACPTGEPCGVTAAYCKLYTPPSTNGATLISSLPYNIKAPGNYYLDSNLSSTDVGIYVTYTGGLPIDVNLNGHTITYGTIAKGSGPTGIGEYGFLTCAHNQLASLDSSYATNGYCSSSGGAPGNITVENGSFVQSPNASQYYDPNNCPGSGIGFGAKGACSSFHNTVMSNVLMIDDSYSFKATHLSLTWQNVDSNGIYLPYLENKGTGALIECNTFNDKVQLINNRAYPEGAPINFSPQNNPTTLSTIQYNTFVGSPQTIIWAKENPMVIQYNDINAGYYQTAAYEGGIQRTYSNDYSITCPTYQAGVTSVVAYNYIHNTNGRGIGCIYDGNEEGLNIHNNYVVATESDGNGEYGTNGSVNGGSWVGGCEIDGARGFEAKGSMGINLYDNYFGVQTNSCGGGGIWFTGFMCTETGCPAASSDEQIIVHNNTINIQNTSGSITSLPSAACFGFDTASGQSGYFQTPFTDDVCTTDGDFIQSDAYQPGDYFSWVGTTFNLGSLPFKTLSGDPAGLLVNWQGRSGPPTDQLGYFFQDLKFGSGAGLNFFQPIWNYMASSATVQWSYTPTVKNSSGAIISGAVVSVKDAGGQTASCTTNAQGQCSLVLRQETVASTAGHPLVTTNMNSNNIVITSSGCSNLNYSLNITAATADSRVLTCN